MLKKVYHSKDLDNCVYELKQDFPDVDMVYCSEITFDEFCLLHNLTLLNENTITAFVGVDTFGVQNLLNVLNAPIEVEVCWLFKKVDKRTKVYKLLKSQSTVEECVGLSDARKKKSFVSKCFKESKISTKFLSYFLQVCSDSKPIVLREVLKFKVALEVLPEKQALRSLTLHKVDSHTLNFVSSLFNGTEVHSVLLASRVSHVPTQVLTATLLKRLQSLIYLSIGQEIEAKNYWDRRGYYLNEDVKCANRVGYSALLKSYTYVDQVFGNFLTKDSEYLRLLKLIRFIYSLRI